MFSNCTATAELPASDLARPKAWYSDKLGLTAAKDLGPMGATYDLGGTTAFLRPTQYAGTPSIRS